MNREKITSLYHADESYCVEQLLAHFSFIPAQQKSTAELAKKWITQVRSQTEHAHQLNTLLAEYNLSTEEGAALMALAESLLRIPDTYNIDRLIENQLTTADWAKHEGHSHSWWVNAATWGLLLSGKILRSPAKKSDGIQSDGGLSRGRDAVLPLDREQQLGCAQRKNKEGIHGSFSPGIPGHWSHLWHNLLSKTGKPVIREAIKAALHALGKQFVLAETIEHAVKLSSREKFLLFSFDMLGEAAYTAEDAQKYYQEYLHAINTLAKENFKEFNFHNPGISVKLSALHPRFEFTQQERLRRELFPRIVQLAQAAKQANITLTVDAEEAVRLDITLDLFAALISEPSLRDWQGLGLAVQAYQKRAPAVIDWLIELAEGHKRRIPVRLVKGAYWDSEIKYAQEHGFDEYPVYTRKQSTDVSYLLCAQKMLSARDRIYAQFGTHNAYTVAAILTLAEEYQDFEWQRLHGMGEALYTQVLKDHSIPCRVYAPVGKYEVLLPYLARRLLENGANSSFVHQIASPEISVEKLIEDPVTVVKGFKDKRHPAIALPRHIFPDRLAAKGYDLSDRGSSLTLNFTSTKNIEVQKMQNEIAVSGAVTASLEAFLAWSATPVVERANCLLRAADLLEQHMPRLMSIAIQEAGKTIPNAQGEIREAVDFCRYYAQQAIQLFSTPELLPGPTGESNHLTYQGRGVIACISPWNFPLAIFLGQVTAALAAGNTVLAKPAEQTPLIAAAGVELLHQAGIPKNVLQLLQGTGETVGAQLVSDPRIAGVIFTGSTETARIINQTLAQRQGPIIPFIAETGGVNALVVDSTALLEQAVQDTLISAFDSAGQRCSAARILLIQEEVADAFLIMLKGAMAEWCVGDPSVLSTDVGPVIDQDALTTLENHQAWLNKHAKLIFKMPKPDLKGTFFAPCAYELSSLEQINKEVFGPILHVVRYAAKELPQQLSQLQAKGFGLTFGMHTRLHKEAEKRAQQLRIGNIYINRSMIGAVVGSQPFGGQGLSGTGPKAGGPHYLMRLVNEKVVSINTTASGGNTALASL